MAFKRIKDWATSITSFRSGDVIPVDGPSGTAKMGKDDLLKETAQNALAGNVAQAFDQTRDNTNPYKAGESVVYEGDTYTFKVDHYGAWTAADADKLPMDWIYGYNTEFLLKADNGKNLFNKNTKNKAVGKYVNYSSGNMGNVANYTAFVVPVPENTDISVRYASVHVAAFSGIPFLPYCNNGSQAGYISGFLTNNNPGGKTWTTPLGTKCVVVSYDNSIVDDGQVELSSVPTTFEPFKTGLDVSRVLGLSNLNNKFLYVGSGQTYTTIMSAVNAANDGDTIVIMPGTYNEEVDIRSTGKFLNIIGTQRDKCIITHSNGDYYHPPMEIDKGYVANLTIRATGTTLDAGATMYAYCVHIDYDSEENEALQFVNCNFENDAREAVGIGLRENYTLSFKGCTFVNNNLVNATQPRVFYCHEGPGNNHTGQKCELIDCTFNSPSNGRAFAIVLQQTGANTGNDADFLIQRSIMKTGGTWWSVPLLMWDYSTNAPATGGAKWKGSSVWNLDPCSALNEYSDFDY